MVDILVIGNPLADRHTRVEDTFLQTNELEKGQSKIDDPTKIEQAWSDAQGNENWALAGSGTTVAQVLSRLSNKIALCGKIGSDQLGQKVLDKLQNIGIKFLLPKGNGSTGIANCFITEDNERTMQVAPGACFELSAEDITQEHFEGMNHVHIEGYVAYFGDVLTTSVSFASEQTISLDLGDPTVINAFKSKFEAVIPQVDYVFGNKETMTNLTGQESTEEMASYFDQTQTVVITDGGEGCWVKWQNTQQVTHFPAKEIDAENIIDTTNAGDLFAGAFLHTALRERSMEECVDIAQSAARLAIQVYGSDLSAEHWGELILRIALLKN